MVSEENKRVYLLFSHLKAVLNILIVYMCRK